LGEDAEAIAGVNTQQVAVDRQRGSPRSRPPLLSVAQTDDLDFQSAAITRRDDSHGIKIVRRQSDRSLDRDHIGTHRLRRRRDKTPQVVVEIQAPTAMMPGGRSRGYGKEENEAARPAPTASPDDAPADQPRRGDGPPAAETSAGTSIDKDTQARCPQN